MDKDNSGSLESILLDLHVDKMKQPNALKQAIAKAVSRYLDTHDLIITPEIKGAVRNLVDQGKIPLIETDKNVLGSRCYFDHKYIGMNMRLRSNAEFQHIDINTAAKRLPKGQDVDTVTFLYDYPPNVRSNKKTLHYKTCVYYKDEDKMLANLQKMLRSDVDYRHYVSLHVAWRPT